MNLNIKARSLKLYKTKFTIATNPKVCDGETSREVEGFTHDGSLFLDKRNNRNWVVSHKSGFRLFACDTKRDAAIIMEQLYTLMDWSKPAREVQVLYREIADDYRKLLRYYGGI
jgi:hypothetical protein